MQGTIPSSFFVDLQSLSSFDLSGNWISGTLPSLLSDNLVSADFSFNAFVSSVQSFFLMYPVDPIYSHSNQSSMQWGTIPQSIIGIFNGTSPGAGTATIDLRLNYFCCCGINFQQNGFFYNVRWRSPVCSFSTVPCNSPLLLIPVWSLVWSSWKFAPIGNPSPPWNKPSTSLVSAMKATTILLQGSPLVSSSLPNWGLSITGRSSLVKSSSPLAGPRGPGGVMTTLAMHHMMAWGACWVNVWGGQCLPYAHLTYALHFDVSAALISSSPQAVMSLRISWSFWLIQSTPYSGDVNAAR